MSESIDSLERWVGGFPGEHEYSSLAELELDSNNPELEVFLDAAKNLVEHWHGNKFVGLYLYGTPGTGKSHAAIGLGRALHEAGADVFYEYAPEMAHIHNPETWRHTRFGNDLRYDGNRHAPFPSDFSTDTSRNPKSVLIVDDYRPEAQIALHNAVDAAAQYGGLVVVTSNYTDPFKLVEVTTPRVSDEKFALEKIIEQAHPQIAEELATRRQEAAKTISDSLRSRIAAAFKFIEFKGEDRRTKNTFWA